MLASWLLVIWVSRTFRRFDSDNPDLSLEQAVKKIMRRGEPVFLYRISGKVMTPPDGYYWRIMGEHPSMRIYQLELRDGIED